MLAVSINYRGVWKWVLVLAFNTYAVTGHAANQSPPCFTLHHIHLLDPLGQPVGAQWQRYVDDLAIDLPACFSGNDINDLQQAITAQLLADGWVTTRIGIPAQDITTGELQLTLFVGSLAEVMETSGLPPSRWRPALAMNEGEPLNLRDIEQTVETEI